MGKWTDHEIKRLHKLAEEGLTATVIGNRLGRTASSVRRKMSDLGIERNEHKGFRVTKVHEKIKKAHPEKGDFLNPHDNDRFHRYDNY